MRWSIRVPLLAGLAALIVILALTLTYTVQRMVTLSNNMKLGIQDMQDTNELATGISTILLKQYNLCKNYSLKANPSVKEEFISLSFSVSERYLQLEKVSSNVRELQKINELKSEHYRFETIAMGLFEARDKEDSKSTEKSLADLDEQLDSLATKLKSLNDVSIIRSNEIADEFQASLFNHAWMIGVVVAITLLGSILYFVIVRHAVLKPTGVLIDGTKKVAAGELSFDIDLSVKNELGDLAQSFNTMLDRLRKNRAEITDKTEALEKLNSEITALNETLERKVEERTKALKKSEVYLERIIYGAPVSIAIFDGDGICRDFNDAFIRFIGIENKDGIGGSVKIGETLALSDREFVIAFQGAMQGENRRTGSIGHVVFNRQRWYVHNFFPAYDVRGEVGNIILFSEDVTEQKKAWEIVQEKNKELESFVYTVSHDLKSPLFSVSGMIRMLESDLGDQKSPAQQRYMERILANIGNMEQMINDLLELSRIGSPHATLQNVALNKLLHKVWLGEKVRYGSDDVQFEVDELPEALVDDRQIAQLFSNLIGNAFKYSDTSRPLQIKISYSNEGDYHRFTVEDNGIGINPEIFPNIFDVFFRDAPKEVEGTGVGLAISKKIIENHGGKIWVESTPGLGTKFHFTLAKRPDLVVYGIRS